MKIGNKTSNKSLEPAQLIQNAATSNFPQLKLWKIFDEYEMKWNEMSMKCN